MTYFRHTLPRKLRGQDTRTSQLLSSHTSFIWYDFALINRKISKKCKKKTWKSYFLPHKLWKKQLDVITLAGLKRLDCNGVMMFFKRLPRFPLPVVWVVDERCQNRNGTREILFFSSPTVTILRTGRTLFSLMIIWSRYEQNKPWEIVWEIKLYSPTDRTSWQKLNSKYTTSTRTN